MAAHTNLENRVNADPAWEAAYQRVFPDAERIATAMLLVHVSGRTVPFERLIQEAPHEIPISTDTRYYTDLTRRAEDLLRLGRSCYFYAGRAHPEFGDVALAFAPACEAGHTGSATPFDSGGLVHPARYIKLELRPADTEDARVAYGRESVIPLADWWHELARFLSAYFQQPVDYWLGTPSAARPDAERMLVCNTDWRAWTFEVRFGEPQSIYARVAWCARKAVMDLLARLDDEDDLSVPGTSPLDRFFEGPPALEPRGSPNFFEVMETWIRAQLRLLPAFP